MSDLVDSNQPYGIHWFRRDLRVAGNPALQTNFKQMKGRVVGVFCFDSTFLSRADFSRNRFGFFLKTLQALQAELRALGSDLIILDKPPQRAFDELLTQLKSDGNMPRLWTFNRDYEPFARKRDAEVEALILSRGVELTTDRDHVLIEPLELTKGAPGDGGYYQIYTPFSKRWMSIFQTAEIQTRVRAQQPGLAYLKKLNGGQTVSPPFSLRWENVLSAKAASSAPFRDCLDTYATKVLREVTIPLPEAGSLAAWKTLQRFTKDRLEKYPETRDIPSIPGTSQVSIYLKNGSLTTSQIIAHFGELIGTQQPTHYLKELIWREFYYHILYHRPDVETHAFQARADKIAWENNESYFEAWKAGMTGYPIVDAGMRQLKATGWMHNRVRMIVASFLTKDLLVSWQWGERYFMETLLDGDLAPNNGGWQWAASTGCDAQPYFRIFNPKLQSERFDPKGEYIRKWIPELKNVSDKEIHAPGPTPGYPAPIVDHAAQKPKAIALFKS